MLQVLVFMHVVIPKLLHTFGRHALELDVRRPAQPGSAMPCRTHPPLLGRLHFGCNAATM